ncbi:S10 family peptidase [Henriciella aquimarina]|uniref:S10 family peptidase n=1 Tax=Henriciella aquimarina TaxID=545261 RepID=UPI001F48C11D|nr:septum formation initiator [Henriciella aquimarina]
MSIRDRLKTGRFLALGLMTLAGCANAQDYDLATSSPQEAQSKAADERVAPARDVETAYRKVTHHTLVANGERIAYDAIAGETLLTDLSGDPTARIFTFTYLRTDVDDPDRPVLFIFNGGPGSASLWIHMGAIGPKQVVLDAEVNPSNVPPFGLQDNTATVLDVADLVFIDPVGTGFSRPAEGVDPERFWGVDEDAEAMSQFIELWLSEHGRWNSPKYVLGESYGTMRAAVLPRFLMGSPIYNGVMRGITLDGIVLLGTTLGARAEEGAEKPAGDIAARQARTLPGLAVTAAYHGQSALEGDADEIYSQASAYAYGPYKAALLKRQQGMLDEAERQSVMSELTRMIGLSADKIGEDLHISEREFAKLVLDGQGLEVGMYDSRYTLPLANSGNDPVADDPAMTRYVPGFVAAFNEMLRDDLEVRLPRPYKAIYWKDLLQSWNWQRRAIPPGQSFAVDLAIAMRRNPDLRLFVASGYYDLVTTPAEAKAQIESADIPRERVRFEDYTSGHMLYLGGTAEAFADDLRAFLTAD